MCHRCSSTGQDLHLHQPPVPHPLPVPGGQQLSSTPSSAGRRGAAGMSLSLGAGRSGPSAHLQHTAVLREALPEGLVPQGPRGMYFWVNSAGFLLDFSCRFGGQTLTHKRGSAAQRANHTYTFPSAGLPVCAEKWPCHFTLYILLGPLLSCLFISLLPLSPYFPFFALSDCAFLKQEISFPVSGLYLHIHIYLPAKRGYLSNEFGRGW